MKYILFFTLFLSAAANAQGTFRIYDQQMNDVTGGTISFSDTGVTAMQVVLNVENTDTATHQVLAARFVTTQPATAANAISWGTMMYVPAVDTAMVAESIAPGGTSVFVGDYFPNNTMGTATITYCFWDQQDTNNISCVTVNFDHTIANGGGTPAESGPPLLWYGPNPAKSWFGIGWSPGTYDRIDLFSSDGRLISSAVSETGFGGYEYEVTNMPEGIYYVCCSNSKDGSSTSFTFIVAH